MRPQILLITALAFSTGGCGTFMNVTAPVGPSTGPQNAGPTACEPFGGVKRSVMGGSMLAFGGNPVGILAATVAVGVDTPLSLVGDVVTLPYVYGRIHGAPWANSATDTGSRSKTGSSAESAPIPPANPLIQPVDRKVDPMISR